MCCKDRIEEIRQITERFDFVNVTSANDLVSLSLGSGNKSIVFLSDGTNGDAISSRIVMRFFERLCIAYKNDLKISSIKIRNILRDQRIVIIPCFNTENDALYTSEEFEKSALYNLFVSMRTKYLISVSCGENAISYFSKTNSADCSMMAQVFKSITSFHTRKMKSAEAQKLFKGEICNALNIPFFEFSFNFQNPESFENDYRKIEELLILSSIM